ncbi:hypothetical protein HK100_003185 [Physocladia obscura]|uniref:NADP-dependent oxidoreductase domain-containing protein n=1 Tax=Physocladia obscura TaxID=109957 RepID=A0AAD5T7N3_9FUNG|nr:hypothetical protein HK100_003185 [Physocladia obscura]
MEPLTLSRIVYGTMRLAGEPREIVERIKACLDLGITTFDLADIYGDFEFEELFGKALALEPELRPRMQIVTKCDIVPNGKRDAWVTHYNASRDYILSCVNRSLEKIQTDYIDLLLLHRPDPLLNPDEVASAFEELYASKKVRHFGVSNFTPSQFRLVQSRLPAHLSLQTNQIEFSVLHTAPIFDGTLDQLLEIRAVPMAWSPLAGGANAWPRGGGLFGSNKTEQDKRVVAALEKVADQLGPDVGIDHVAYAWLFLHPSQPRLVVGTNDLARLKRAVDSTVLKLNRQQWYYILEASQGQPVP